MKSAPRTTPRIKPRFNSTEEEITDLYRINANLLAALKRLRLHTARTDQAWEQMDARDKVALIDECCAQADAAIAAAETDQ